MTEDEIAEATAMINWPRSIDRPPAYAVRMADLLYKAVQAYLLVCAQAAKLQKENDQLRHIHEFELKTPPPAKKKASLLARLFS